MNGLRRRAAALGPRRTIPTPAIDGALLRHSDGTVSSIIATADLDLDALDDRRRAAVLAAFASLCRSLDQPLSVIVQVRRVAGAWAGDVVAAAGTDAAGTEIAALDAAMRSHWRDHLTRNPTFHRTVLFISRGGDRARLERNVTAIVDTLTNAGVQARTLTGEELIRCVRAAYGTTDRRQAALTVREQPARALVGDTWVRGQVVRHLPGAPVRAGWLAGVLSVGGECDIAIHLVPASAAEAVSSLGRRLRGLSAQRLLDLDRGALTDAWNEAAIDSASMLRDRLARNVSLPVRLSLCAVARGEDATAADRVAEVVRSAFGGALARIETTRFRHVDAALTASPFGGDRLHEQKLVDARAAATCVPWTQASFDDGAGCRLGALRTTGAPVRVDPFDATRYPNANVVILAASGQGKSFAIGTFVLEALTRHIPSVIVDPEGEYRSLIAGLHGDYLDLAPGRGTSVNVFDLGAGPRGDEADAGEAVQAVVELVTILCGALDEVQRAHVDMAARRAQRRARERGRCPLLADCIDELAGSAPDVAVVLRRVCSGPLGELFSRPTSIRLDAPVTGVSFGDLSAEFVPAATLIVARWLWGLVRGRRRRRHVIFDEVGGLALHPPLRTLLVQLARRCRKYHASLIVATQNANDLLRSEEGTVVATNCGIVLLGGHRAVETALMERAFGLTAAQRRHLETAGRGEFLLIAGSRRAEIRIDVPSLHQRLLRAP